VGSDPSGARRRRHLDTGRRGEEEAERFLSRLGYRVVSRRFLARRGEIDLVCRRGEQLVMVEVKTRSTDAFGAPAEAVGDRKRRALLAAAAEYRALAGWKGPISFALVAILGDNEPELFEDVFD
jgi:putative endonuclease